MATRFSDIPNPNAPRTEPQSWDRLRQMFGLSFQPADGSAPVPSNWGWDQQSWEAAGGGNNSGFFDGLGDIFSWGGGNQPPAAPAFTPPPQVPISAREGTLPPPNIPQMPPVPGRMSPEGGQPNAYDMTTAEDAMMPPVEASQGMEQAAPKAYSFMDNPGASDAMVAFGAAMLKAPSFNQGLGDAALAVNQVARSYRMPTEQDYAKARQLGMIKRIASGNDGPASPEYGSATMGYAPIGPNGEDVAVPSFLDPARGFLFQMPDGSMSPTPPQGWVKATDSELGAFNRGDAKEQAQLQAKVAAEVRSANLSERNYRDMLGMVDTSGVGSDLRTRLAANIARLGGYNFDGVDVSDQAVFNQKFKELNIDFAQKLQGQGQITEFERQIIAESLPQAGMNADAAKRVLKAMIDGAERKQAMWKKWRSDVRLRAEYDNRYEIYESEYLAEEDAKQRNAAGGSSPAGGSNPELEDALNRYPGN